MSSPRRIDCHVHLVADGSAGNDGWFTTPGLYKTFLSRMMVRGVGLPSSVLQTGLDKQYASNLAQTIRESSLDAAVVLAQDIPYDASGRPMPKAAQYYVPNDYTAALADEHPEFIPACSIHPGRPDAFEELEKCIGAGMPVMKLLPNCLGIDYTEERYVPFWERMAQAGMILLTHTGGEMTLKVLDASLGDPKKLERVLECGVTAIAAHCAGRSGIWDEDWTEDLIEMFGDHPNLYADNSALCSPNRARTLRHVRDPEIQKRILHGSDYPVPVSGLGPWAWGYLPWDDFRRTSKSSNILERDAQLKEAIGFEAATFTRLDGLLR